MNTLTLFDTSKLYRCGNVKQVVLTSEFPQTPLALFARRMYRLHRKMGTTAYVARLATIGSLASTYGVTAGNCFWDAVA